MRLRWSRGDAPVDAKELRAQIYAHAGSRTRVTSVGGLRDAAAPRALTQASNQRTAKPWPTAAPTIGERNLVKVTVAKLQAKSWMRSRIPAGPCDFFATLISAGGSSIFIVSRRNRKSRQNVGNPPAVFREFRAISLRGNLKSRQNVSNPPADF
jgi:hypothetical protein